MLATSQLLWLLWACWGACEGDCQVLTSPGTGGAGPRNHLSTENQPLSSRNPRDPRHSQRWLLCWLLVCPEEGASFDPQIGLSTHWGEEGAQPFQQAQAGASRKGACFLVAHLCSPMGGAYGKTPRQIPLNDLPTQDWDRGQNPLMLRALEEAFQKD